MSQAKTRDGMGRGVRVHVAAFGKHPGWDDHIEEIGLDSSMLVNAKRVLYTECIGGCIDLGEWEKLEEDRRIPFKHQFYWRTTEGLLIGRMWASRDGKGRTKYPMVVCAVIEGVPDSWAVQQALPRLAAVEEKCAQTNSAELVRLAIGECRGSLESAVAAYDGSAGESAAQLLSRLVQSPALSENGGEGLKRVLYEMEREFVEFRPTGNTSIRSRASTPPAQQIRVPKALQGPGEAALAWLTLLDQEVSRSIPLLLVEPIGERYIDLIVGDMRPKQFFCVRAGEKALGLTSDVPYTMDPAVVGRAEEKIEAWSHGRALEGDEPITSGAAPDRAKSNLKLALLGVAGILVVAIAIMLTRAGKPDKANADQPPPVNKADAKRAAPQPAPQPAPVERPAESPPEPAVASNDPADPRTSWGYAAAASRARAALDKLDRELAVEQAPARQAERQRLEDIERRAAIVRSKPWRPASREALARDIAGVDSELAEVQASISEAMAGVASRIDAMLAERAKTAPVRTTVMTAAWGTGLAAIDRAGGWEHARSRAAALEADLKAAEAGVIGVALVQAPDDSMISAAAFKAAAEARRETALRAAADAAAAGDRARVQRAADELREWNGQAVSLLDQAVQLQAMMRAGRVLDASAKPTASQVIASMQGSPAFKELGPALQPALEQVEAVRAVGSLNAPAALIEVIRAAAVEGSGKRAPAAVAAWQRLSDLNWPSLPADMVEAASVRTGDLRSVLGGVADSAQRQALEALTAGPARSMWQRFAAQGAINQAGVDAAAATRDAMGAQGVQESLPAFIRYNLLRKELVDALSAAGTKPAGEREEARRAAVDAFLQKVPALGAELTQKPGVSALINGLKKVSEAMAVPDVSALGPASAGWKAGPVGEDGTVTFTHEKGGELVFRRLAADGQAVTFMSTAEVSVGQFITAVGGAGKWDEAKTLLISYPPGGDDPRRGPRSWEWSSDAAEVMSVAAPGEGDTSRGWLRVKSSMAGKEYYPAGLTVEPPTRDHPMQYVSPGAAVLAARALGCRLPTAAEWEAGVKAGTSEAQNLRDGTWRKQFDKCKELLASGPDYPSGGAFRPAELPRLQPTQDGFAAVDGEDGFLWFAPVGGGPRFQHLIGNVAEFVWEDAAAMEALPASGTAIKTALGRWEKLRIVGGSALSAKDVPTNVPQAVAFTQSPEGWSDVGFRLAFTAPRGAGGGGAADLDATLASSGYLLGGE